MRHIMTVEQKINASVPVPGPLNTPCLIWPWRKSNFGYGLMKRKNYPVLVHRTAWQLKNGPIPPGMCVCHRCDVRACVNTDHLFLGTLADNTRDMHNKGRGYIQPRGKRAPRGYQEYQVRGERHPRATLDTDKVRYIRARLQSGTNCRAIARELGVGPSVVYSVKIGRTWKHLP